MRAEATRCVAIGLRASGVFGSMFLLGGCPADRLPPPIPVEEQWSAAIRNFAFIPIYPMREDVKVGDIELVVDPKSINGRQLATKPLGYMDVAPILEAHYKKRKALPRTGTTKPPSVGTGASDSPPPDLRSGAPWPQPEDPSGNIFANSRPEQNLTRPRLVALPGIQVAQLTAGQLGARFPVATGAEAAAGAAGERSVALSIFLNGIEEISAPNLLSMDTAFEEWCSNDSNSKNVSQRSIELSLSTMLPEMSGDTINKAKPRLAVITRVLYARAIDYTTSSSLGFSAQIAAVAEGLSALRQLAPQGQQGQQGQAQQQGNVTSASDASTSVLAQRAQLQALAAQMMGTVAASSSPGLSASFVFVDSRGLTLREVFDRPLAFAAEAITYDVDLQTDTCLNRRLTTAGSSVYIHGTLPDNFDPTIFDDASPLRFESE